MKIAFRVDASNAIGTGHVIRCITLARLFKERGADIQFICRSHEGHLSELIIKNNFNIKLISQSKPINKEKNSGNNYLNLLGVSQIRDAEETTESIKNQKPDWLIIDNYALDYKWENLLSSYSKNIMVIDDLPNRKHTCNLFLNYNYTKLTIKDYKNFLSKNSKILLGPKYALLSFEYTNLRKKFLKHPTNKISNILLSLGGSDNENITSFVIDVLSETEFSHLKLNVVIGMNNKNRDIILQKVNKRANTFIHEGLTNVASLLANTDLCIGAGGLSTWERICLAVPSLVFCVSQNQKPAFELLLKENLIQSAGTTINLSKVKLKNKILNVMRNSSLIFQTAFKAQSYVDGFGTNRLVEIIYPSKKNDLVIRDARDSDLHIYYNWVNDLAVRSSAFNSNPINIDQHRNWYTKQLNNSDSYLFVLQANGLPVGQIRFNFKGEEAFIDYSLDDFVRNRGWSDQLIRLGVNKLHSIRPSVINAEVKQGNTRSLAVFLRLGFKEKSVNKNKHLFAISSKKLFSANI